MAKDITELDSTKKRLFFLLKDELAGGERRLDYKVLAERLAISRTSVTYNMKLLKQAGYVGTRDGKLYLKKSG